MKTKLQLLFILALLPIFSSAASISLTFSGFTTEGRYCLLDSVHIENITHNWETTLDCSQDTTFDFNISNVTTGMDNVETPTTTKGLISNCQTYGLGSSLFTINPLNDGIVSIRVFNTSGHLIIMHQEYLNAGFHQYALHLSQMQTYILSVITETETDVEKIVNMGCSSHCNLYRTSSVPSIPQYTSRRNSPNNGGDLMRYIGYTTQRGQAVASDTITQYQSSDEQIVFTFAPVAKSTEGMYVSMMGFNSELYSYDFDILQSSNLTKHQQWVSNLGMKSGTILYHAVYTSLNNMMLAPVPVKLENISLVTFTDGLDFNSWRMNSNYRSNEAYLNAVSKQIGRTYIDGIKLDAYAIGVKGSDVTDINRFENDLHRLSSAPENVYSVSNMDEVNARFREIAAKIYNKNVEYSLTIKLPAPEPNSKIRFTFDDITDAVNSIYYIEGIYDYDFDNYQGSLTNVTYYGLQCDNGSTWTSVPDGIFDIFKISNLSNSLGERLSTTKMKQWIYIPSTGKWQINSEFDTQSHTATTEERTSAIVALVLDCSSSLDSDFSKMQSAANSFLSILAGKGNISKASVSKTSCILGDLQATLKSSVSNTGNLNILDKGFCVSEYPNMDNATFYSAGEGVDNFEYTIGNLVEGKTYYCCSYATNQLGTTYGEIMLFTAVVAIPPTVTTTPVQSICCYSAVCGGNIVDKNYSDVIEKGVCWSISPNPTINDSIQIVNDGIGTFSTKIDVPFDGTTYYVRAYAKNIKGVGYGEEIEFSTLALVKTEEVGSITISSARCVGLVINDNSGISVTERGFCWSTDPNPTIENCTLESGAGVGSFAGIIDNLQDNTVYYVRAYAKSKSISYGEEKCFTTIKIVSPTLTTANVTAITANSATCGGEITSDGNSPVIERGLCWSASPNPTVEDSVLIISSNSKNFKGAITGLSDGVTYYVRSFAKNSKEIGYGNEQVFTTLTIISPILDTLAISNITASSAICGGNITFDGYAPILERGICWSTSPNPTVEDNVLVINTNSMSFSDTITGLRDGTTYYVRSFAKNSKEIGYGNEQVFNTLRVVEPKVSLLSTVKEIAYNSVMCTGEITFDGYAPIIERGFCWSTSPNPTIEDNIVIVETDTTIFDGILSNLEINTYCYIRAYAKNKKSIGYSTTSKILYISAITYTAPNKLNEGINLDAFNVSVKSHEFSDGIGVIVFNGKVTSIGEFAFADCSGLTSIEIPNSVISIGRSAFRSCSSLTSITIPNSVRNIGSSAFMNCSSLTSITIPNGITGIGEEAFKGCSSLTSVTVPNSVTTVGGGMFYACNKLESVVLSNSIISLPTYDGGSFDKNKYGFFEDCSSLTSITIPNSITGIGEEAFKGCSNLTSVVWNAKNCSDFEEGSSAPFYSINDNITSFTFGDSVEHIPAYLCSGQGELTSIIIPNSVRNIGSYAFMNCSSLTSVTIGNSVTGIGSYAFQGCSSLTSVTIPNRVTSIGNSAFDGCSSLTSITIPNSVKSIGSYVFENCSSLDSVMIGNGVTKIGSSVFNDCPFLSYIVVDEGNTTYDSRNDCNAIITTNTNMLVYGGKNTIIPNDVQRIVDNAFCGRNALCSITIPNSVTSIGDGAFSGCYFVKKNFINYSQLDAEDNYYWGAEIVDDEIDGLLIKNGTIISCRKNVVSTSIPEGITSIGSYAFQGCSSLTSITIPNSVTSIERYAFKDCSSLNFVTIGNSVTSIGDGAFSGCSSLTKTNYIGDVAGWCDIKFGYAEANPMYYSHNFYINNQEIIDLIIPNTVDSIHDYAFSDCSSLTSVTIPNSITSIGFEAFAGCKSLTKTNYIGDIAGWCKIKFGGFGANPMNYSHNFYINDQEIKDLVIPNTVGSIHNYAFYNCFSLTSITLPNSVTSIGNSAFCGCFYLTSITIPNSVTSIGNYAFYDCSSLTSVTIGNSVTSIGDRAFYYCSSMNEIICNAITPPTCSSYIFSSSVENTANLYVPSQSLKTYKEAQYWKYFDNILPIEEKD